MDAKKEFKNLSCGKGPIIPFLNKEGWFLGVHRKNSKTICKLTDYSDNMVDIFDLSLNNCDCESTLAEENNNDKLIIAVFENGKKPYLKQVNRDHDTLTEIVKGELNIISGGRKFSDYVIFIQEVNNKTFDEEINDYRIKKDDPIYGTFFIVRDGSDTIESMTEKDLEKVTKKLIYKKER